MSIDEHPFVSTVGESQVISATVEDRQLVSLRPDMVTQRADVVARDEFLAVVLADPELLALAFAELIASWEAEPPWPPLRRPLRGHRPRSPDPF